MRVILIGISLVLLSVSASANLPAKYCSDALQHFKLTMYSQENEAGEVEKIETVEMPVAMGFAGGVAKFSLSELQLVESQQSEISSRTRYANTKFCKIDRTYSATIKVSRLDHEPLSFTDVEGEEEYERTVEVICLATKECS